LGVKEESDMEIAIIASWIIFSIIGGVIAKHKGRSAIGFFLLCLLLSPLIGIIAALVSEPNVAKLESARIASGESKKCPYCAEIIKREATVCRYCGREVSSASSSSSTTGLIYEHTPEFKEMRTRALIITAIVAAVLLIIIVLKGGL
jgi:hypothetical protein